MVEKEKPIAKQRKNRKDKSKIKQPSKTRISHMDMKYYSVKQKFTESPPCTRALTFVISTSNKEALNESKRKCLKELFQEILLRSTNKCSLNCLTICMCRSFKRRFGTKLR